MSKVFYIVHEYCIDDYETKWEDFHLFEHEKNAIQKIKDIRDQDMMPIAEQYGFEIACDCERLFAGGRDGNYAKDSFKAEMIKTTLLD